MNMHPTIVATLLGLTVISTSALAFNNCAERDEVPAIKAGLTAAKISLPAAITTAEAHVAGQAVEAKLDAEASDAAYEVEVLKGDQLMEVKVDSRDGKVLSATVDLPDGDGDDDECDD